MSDFTSQLQMLLANDPEYRAAYERTWDVLTDAETRAQSTIDALEAQLERDEAALEALTRSAASLPDGTKVFRAADGSLKTQEGTDVSHLSDHVVWRGDEPSWEDYRDQQARTENLRGDLDAWRYYQVETLGHARDRLSDEDNPPSVEELDEIQRDIEAKMPQAPEPTEPAEAADIAVSPAAKIEIPAI
ncbi:hypothetical protein [Mesobacterium pallidum]|uniref:hypothetical protein n=1 Tax=Mesobacterium pallidum TaxID=2872037 RepID=UPI001EE37663|nr:hypothetical protein [Mesobacterium pallidum]